MRNIMQTLVVESVEIANSHGSSIIAKGFLTTGPTLVFATRALLINQFHWSTTPLYANRVDALKISLLVHIVYNLPILH